MKIFFNVVSELVDYGYTEDGEAYIGEAYYVQAESKTGSRWAHYATFHGAKRHDSEDFFGFIDTRVEAQEAAYKLLSRVEASKVDFSNDYWVEVDARYGSEDYRD